MISIVSALDTVMMLLRKPPLTVEAVTIKNWYSGDNYKVETFETGDGKYLDYTNADLLVQAMAGFNPPSDSINNDPTLTSLQDTLNQVWLAKTA